MSYQPPNPNGQATSANSAPVVVASDQSAIPISGTVTASNVAGDIAAGTTDSGNPVKVGGKYLATKPTLSDGQRGDVQLGTRGSVGTQLMVADSVTPIAVAATNADAVAAASVASRLEVINRNSVFNGTTWDRMPGDTTGVKVQPIAITKGTQGATGFTTQDLKDAGRSSIMITATVASTATSETLITITTSKALAATGTSTSTTITSGKKLRIQSITASARNSTGTTAGVATIKIRGAVAGSTTTSSPLQYTSSVALPAAATSVLFPDAHIPDGFEIDSNAGTNTYGVTITHPQWVTGSVVATFDISIVGYEY